MKRSIFGFAVVSALAVGCGDSGTGGGGAGATSNAATGATKATGATATTKASSTATAGATTKASSSATGGGMNVEVNFSDFGAHNGNKFEAAIVSNGQVVQKQMATGAATFKVNFTNIPAGMHKIHYYADLNGDMSCTAPTADHVWEDDINVNGSPVTIMHVADFTDTCATFQ